MKLLNIPIEPIESRYSSQWDIWFKDQFSAYFVKYETIYGCATSGKISTGAFLDVMETNLYKTSQLLQIIEILRNYDDKERLVLFFHDLWFPGLETIAYIRDCAGLKNLRIYGCLHAGSYDKNDFLYKKGTSRWAHLMEISWFDRIVDGIFVATEYHRNLLIDTKTISSKRKIHVTGFPIYPEMQVDVPKEKLVVFPHRKDEEKQPELFEALAKDLQDTGWNFVYTVDACKSKAEYYSLLNRASIAVSFALQETWGIAMQESVFCGAVPICPNRLSYSEMYPKEYLYLTYADAVDKVRYWIETLETSKWDSFFIAHPLLRSGRKAVLNMIKIIDNA